MSAKDISNEGLGQILAEWTEPAGKGGVDKRGIIERDPLLKANLPKLERALAGLGKLRAGSSIPDEESSRREAELKKLNAEIDEADGDFDEPARACFGLLDLASEQAEDEALAAQIAAAKARLFPRGLTVLNLTAAEEAGVARSVGEALDKPLRGLLGKIELRIGGQHSTALSLAEEVVEAGKRLGKLAARKDKLVADRRASEQPETEEAQAGDALRRFREARAAVVKAVSDFAYDIERAETPSAAEKELLLATVQKLASRRPRKAKSPSPQKPTPVPA